MIAVVLGSQRWRRRRAVARLVPTVDAFGRPGFLYLTDTHRKRRAVIDEFVGRSAFQPHVEVLSAWLAALWDRWGDGRALWSDRTAALLALPIIEASPWLQSLGTPEETARSLARWLGSSLHQQRPLADPRASAALDALRQRWDGTNRVHLTLALPLLEQRLRNPSAPLRRWLARQPALVVDDILQPSVLQTHCLLALIDAFDAAGREVVVAFACGDDPAQVLTGEEQEPAFAATRRLRRAVFERYVANGRAEVFVAGPEGPEPLATSPRYEPVDAAPVRLCRAPSPSLEVGSALEELARVLETEATSTCAIAVADESAYLGPVLRQAQRRGLPVTAAKGAALAQNPVGRTLITSVQATLGQLAPQGWVDLARDLDRPVRQLARVLAPAGVLWGEPSGWTERLARWQRDRHEEPGWEQGLEALVALEHTLLGLPPEASVTAWLQAWSRRWEEVGVLDLAERSEENQRAWTCVQAALSELCADLELVTAARSHELLRMLHTLRIPPRDTDAVPVIGLQELRGLTPDHLWVLGLDRSWPARPPPSPLVQANELHALQPVDRLAEGRYLLAQLQRNARDVRFSWPGTRGDRENLPSSLVEALGLTAEPTSTTEPVATPFEPAPQGQLDRPLDRRPRFSVTHAEAAIRCPARFWYGTVLGLRPEDPWDPELEPRRRGTAFHAILQRFYEERELRPVVDRAADAQQLLAVADAIFDELEAQGGFEPALQAWSRSRWTAGLADDRPKGLLAAWLEHELERGIAPAAVERGIRVQHGSITYTGVLDRIERGPHGSLVVDYKTGRPPDGASMAAGLALQPLVYLAALGEGDHASAFQRVARPQDVGFTGWFGSKSAIRAWGGRTGVEADHEHRTALLDQASAALRDVLAGDVSTTVHGPDLGGCNTCTFAHVCRVVHR